jgi:hypothetical protein
MEAFADPVGLRRLRLGGECDRHRSPLDTAGTRVARLFHNIQPRLGQHSDEIRREARDLLARRTVQLSNPIPVSGPPPGLNPSRSPESAVYKARGKDR